MVEVLIAALLCGGVMSLGAHLLRRKKSHPVLLDSSGPAPRAPDSFAPADVVVHARRDFIVRGVARLADGARCWSEVRCLDGDEECWIVAEDGAAEWLWGRRVHGLPLLGEEAPEALDYQDQVFELEQAGYARLVHTHGELGTGLSGDERWGYWEYARVGARRLWVRRGSAGWLAFAGERMPRHLLEIITAS